MKTTASAFSVGSLPSDDADDVVADDLLDRGRDVPLDAHAERDRLEPLGVGLLQGAVHRQAGHGEQLFARLAVTASRRRPGPGLPGVRCNLRPFERRTTE